MPACRTGGNNVRDRRGRLTGRIIAPGGDWYVEAKRSVQNVEPCRIRRCRPFIAFARSDLGLLESGIIACDLETPRKFARTVRRIL
jgi:hypothetical protein